MTTDVCSPLGFVRSPSAGTAVLSWPGGRPEVDGRPLTLPPAAEEIASLRPARALRVEWPSAPDGRALALVTDLAAAGVPLTADTAPAWAREADPELTGLVESWAPRTGEDVPASVADLRREEHSVRLRRHALRRRGLVPGTPRVSVVMATRRPHLLPSALTQIARQRGVDLDLVLALHGFPLSRVRQAVDAFPLPVTVLEADAATPFGEVLNQAAARAEAGLLAKWDDDDWYGPEHLSDLLLARAYTGAGVVGMAQEFFYLEPLKVTVRRTDYTSEVWTDHVAGGTMLVDRALFDEVRGFGPHARGEDAHLLRAVVASGAGVYRTHGLGYVLRRSLGADHTWQLPLAHFLRVAAYQWRGFRPSVILEAP
ncbi:hypothetical protein GCM10009530_16710 [Microbispora corallina]|uniref:Family 2 glycosyl transferase n=1 Tax=Microbispora corallina TaxID=83302 RepID=A0ABQ4FXY8_9ACTN|nr:family 2 glycosyl transferase [Microbispora corallina]GIH39630.1 hypothetical protein Mco01_26300 [Microbispora corallina]